MAKKERNFHGEADFLRHQLRELSVEMGVKIKDTNFMKKEECKEEIAALNRVKYKKELEVESEIVIQELSEKNNQINALEKELADKNNQITTLEKNELSLKKEKQNCIDIILEKDKKIEELKIEIKELETSNQFMNETIENNEKESLEKEKEIEEKNSEIAELKAERTVSQLSLKKKEGDIMELRAILTDKINMIERLNNKKWYQFWK